MMRLLSLTDLIALCTLMVVAEFRSSKDSGRQGLNTQSVSKKTKNRVVVSKTRFKQLSQHVCSNSAADGNRKTFT